MPSAYRGDFIHAASHGLHNGGHNLLATVAAALQRLAPLGWSELLAYHGLNVCAADLAGELTKRLPDIDRSVPGFEDFSLEGVQAIEPGWPARSLLYHAFASPSVTKRNKAGEPLHGYPALAEIEAVENYVYALDPPSIEDLRVRAGEARLAIVVFALEYRNAVGTVHQRHADLVFSRTGVARVGTSPAKYLDSARGFLPFVDGDGTQIRTLPCRYAAFIAALVPGSKDTYGPLRFLSPTENQPTTPANAQFDGGLAVSFSVLLGSDPGDENRMFWIPLHKLYSGDSCIRARDIEVRLSASHTNEKIRRAHLRFLSGGHNGGWMEPSLSMPPFVFHDGIAEFSTSADDGGWLLCPVPHDLLAEPAEFDGKQLTYIVPPAADGNGLWGVYQSSLNLIERPNGARTAPEYLHARHKIDDNGEFVDLNKSPDLIKLIQQGGYRARHYVDYTGDGWIDVECSQIALDLPNRLPAYSLVATPHFFPFVDQTALMQWTAQCVLPSVLHLLWDSSGSGLPQALSDQRIAANLQLSGAGFDPHDDTMTAIVGAFGSGKACATRIVSADLRTASMLPDSAAGVFAPGWDISFDRSSEASSDDTGSLIEPGVSFLANYGLGSPFMEDSKLCAALSAFWPAAAPDITRTFSPGRNYVTSTPLTDEVIGLGTAPPWDGVKGPTLHKADKFVDYMALAYGDYVETALNRGFDISVIGQTTMEDYVARTLTMAMVYSALGVTKHEEKLIWSVLSFQLADITDSDLLEALKATGRRMDPRYTYRYVMIDHADRGATDPEDFKKVRVKFGSLHLMFADPILVLARDDSGTWTAHDFRH
ncbi:MULTISPECIES: hypothetical protein [Paraburkholderia]|uniref:hypothetical protein n=1 Tax=Paraburkholderia TaxID=1822464 RepID=UPI00225487F5|nr:MULTISPECIES: hypothetical protein [Paraburkholderia]MCX4173393.1 hypothetical protein [Paraburkholderia madseniana]MDQ6461398.1 hypothetical protein [Paraburkholderia madseniana]